MSFNSPAKQERIERHLMRQRGAGVRTVSSNFGFAFGSSSNPTSNDATTTYECEEPPAKRRKTILANESKSEDPDMSKLADLTKSVKSMKSRRRMHLDREDTKAAQMSAVDDDSFVAGLQKKKKKITKKRSSPKSMSVMEFNASMQVTEVPPTTQGNPRQRTAIFPLEATDTGMHVEVLDDEETSKPEPSNKASKCRIKVAGSQRTDVDKTKTNHVDYTSEGTRKAAPKKRVAGRKHKCKEETPVEAVGTESNELAILDSRRTGTASVKENVASQRTIPEPAPKPTKRATVPGKMIPRRKDATVQKARTDLQPAAAHLLEAEPAAFLHDMNTSFRERRPLTETDMNTTIRSCSPEKPARKQPSTETKPQKKASRTRATDRPEPTPRPGPKRRKIGVQRDSIRNEDKSPGPVLHCNVQSEEACDAGDETQVAFDSASKPSRKRAPDQGAAKTVERPIRRNTKRPDAEKPPPLDRALKPPQEDALHETGPRLPKLDELDHLNTAHVSSTSNVRRAQKIAASKPETTTNSPDDDVDWLFAPQPQVNVPKSTGTKSKSGNESAASNKRKFKMPEMDLDDLLSNIAVFAQEKSAPGLAAPQNVDLFHSHRTKPRSGARKTAKG